MEEATARLPGISDLDQEDDTPQAKVHLEYFFLKQKLVVIEIILANVLARFIIAKTLKHRINLFLLILLCFSTWKVAVSP